MLRTAPGSFVLDIHSCLRMKAWSGNPMWHRIILHDPCLIRHQVSIKTVGTHMVIFHICKFLNCLIQGFYCFIFIQIGQLIFLSVEISFHRGIVIRVSGFAHTLCNMYRLAEFHKFPGCKLAALVRMQEQFPFYRRLPVQCLLQCPDCKAACHMAVCYAGNNTPVMQI